MTGTIAVALSGGVDSSVAAWLLRRQTAHVVGITLCLGVSAPASGRIRCCGAQEIEDARRVCLKLGIPHHVLDLAPVFQEQVVRPFLAEYRRGRTPNPCVACNRAVKFGALLDRALAMGFDYLATGHYAALDPAGDPPALTTARDARKDQTYFLYAVDRNRLRRVLFPLAPYRKDEVRQLARTAGLPVADKPESQDVCFVSRDGVEAFFREQMGDIPQGEIVDATGRVLGRHRGLPFYTVGQRGGLGVSHRAPLYVISLNREKNQLVVGEKPQVLAAGLVANRVNRLVDRFPSRGTAKIRYGHRPAPCRIEEGKEDDMTVRFDEPQEAVAPGQSVVLYDGPRVLGGGVIRNAIGRTADEA